MDCMKSIDLEASDLPEPPARRGAATSRRDVLIAMGAALPIVAAASALPTAARSDSVEFADRWSEMLAYLKLRARTDDGDAWLWFFGSLELMVPDRRAVRIVDLDGVNVRRVKRERNPKGEERFRKTLWEAVVFSDPATGAVVDELRNPFNGRSIRPYHYREGPTHYVIDRLGRHIVPSADAEPRHQSLAEARAAFPIEWKRSGDDVWVERTDRTDSANLFAPDKWPLESSGERRQDVINLSLHGRWSQATDRSPGVAPAEYAFTAVTGWLPWMLMGQSPGRMLYRAVGRKLNSLDELPATVRAKFTARHAPLLAGGLWSEKRGAFQDYLRERKPEAP